VHPFHSPLSEEVILPAIEQGASHNGRSRASLSVSVAAFTASTPEEMNLARAQIAFYASTPSYRPVMAMHGWSAAAERLSAHASRGEWAEMPALVTDDMLHEFATVASEDQLAAALKQRYEGIADRLTLYTQFVPGEKDEWWRRTAAVLAE
jgi:alkanesulfonate monooxygenase SsuD/methylene tetrahydromethanopterin reductase-like flavin-dependent oxidoreductase (luciferase family)